MPKLMTAAGTIMNLADLFHRLGGIAPARVRFRPPPGTAKEKHVIEIRDREKRLCELVEGVLVEKIMGAGESFLAGILIHLIWTYLESHDLGIVLGEAGMLRLKPRLVRIPDVSFISWDRLPSGEIPDTPIPDIVPDLAVEILSQGNTKREMERKLDDYFSAGVQLVWLIDPRIRIVDVYTDAREFQRLRNGQTLDGGSVLPGFKLPIKTFFARTRRRSNKS